MNKRFRLPSLVGLACLFASLAPGQTAPTTTEPEDKDVLELTEMTISDVPIEENIMPTSRPFNSVFGTDDSILTTPRNVTIISREQLTAIAISDVRDFSKLTSSSYTTTNFGAPSNPSIRGQSADLFMNGVRARITSNGNGMPLDFNAIESVNIVKGPATAVQGTSMYVGGFSDLITKRPYFDKFSGSVSYTIGSYNTNKWTVDFGGPTSEEFAYRVSYSGDYSDGYWHDYYRRMHAFYGAITWRPNDKYELFANAQAYVGTYTENWGINRVTQSLIDDGLYTPGINVNNGTAGTPSDAQNSINVLGAGNSLALEAPVKANRHIRLIRPGDHSYGQEYSAQVIQTFKLGPDLTLKNSTFGSYTERNTLSRYYYSEIIDPSIFAENRTELVIQGKYATVNTGVDLRYQQTKAYDQYFFEPVNVWDLTRDPNLINVYNSTDFLTNSAIFEVPGWKNRFADPGVWNGDTNDSWGFTVGPFVQSTIKPNEKFSIVAGARYDFLHANVREPLLPPFIEDDIDVSIPNVNLSLIYSPSAQVSTYVTYNYSQNTSGAVGNGGGITGWNGAGTELDKENFTQPSRLYEAGVKFSLKENKLFFNVAVFDQERTAKSTSSTVIQEFNYKGFETELNYQPNRKLYATVSYSYIDAEGSAGFQYGLFGGASEMVGEAATVPIGTITQVPGLPQHLFNGLIAYTFANKLSLSANALVTGEMNNNTAGTLVIPWQYSIDATASYPIAENWDLRLTVLNVTDEENWAPPNAVYGNGSILALPGTEVQFTVKYKF